MKKSRLNHKKLSLSKETVRVLSQAQLGQAIGAITEFCTTVCSETCSCHCTNGPTAECSGTC